jgi:hypothetical protein
MYLFRDSTLRGTRKTEDNRGASLTTKFARPSPYRNGLATLHGLNVHHFTPDLSWHPNPTPAAHGMFGRHLTLLHPTRGAPTRQCVSSCRKCILGESRHRTILHSCSWYLSGFASRAGGLRGVVGSASTGYVCDKLSPFLKPGSQSFPSAEVFLPHPSQRVQWHSETTVSR